MRFSVHGLLLTVACAFSLTALAVTEDDSFNKLPAGSTIKFKASTTLAPGTTSVVIGTSVQDTDKDGVPDSQDWCPGTPAATVVWKSSDATSKKCVPTHIGCSASKSETWLYQTANPASHPKGWQVDCKLLALGSTDYRTLDKEIVFTVVDRKDPYLIDEEISNLAYTELDETTYLENIVLRSPGGETHFGLSCLGLEYETFSDGRFVPTSERSAPRILHLKPFVDFTIAKPDAIP